VVNDCTYIHNVLALHPTYIPYLHMRIAWGRREAKRRVEVAGM
jgi:hypothetical protein